MTSVKMSSVFFYCFNCYPKVSIQKKVDFDFVGALNLWGPLGSCPFSPALVRALHCVYMDLCRNRTELKSTLSVSN